MWWKTTKKYYSLAHTKSSNKKPFILTLGKQILDETRSLLIQIEDTLHKTHLLEIEEINVTESILVMNFPQLVLDIKGAKPVTLHLFTKRKKHRCQNYVMMLRNVENRTTKSKIVAMKGFCMSRCRTHGASPKVVEEGKIASI
ncbi:protein EXORDIUM [Cinnamomum micranthum f. kanehirae]|uniref:Protein EXORDIUM n=1 Tax=Cinnamomum micranthum f. kanehirae TaxID=337451 RepID=A0A3S3MUP7_9MAGN|nr:protein EXORDIUM [Cinnamomum micranthum f. kanehirae]